MPIASLNPTTEQTEKVFEVHSTEEVEARLARAAEAAGTLRTTSFAQRTAWMHATADLLEDDVEQLAEILTREMGKPIRQAREEVLKSGRALRFYADHAAEFLGETRLDEPSAVGASEAWTRYEPLGVLLAVMPWNYPIWQVLRFAAPALMAGNAGLLKHASNVPQAASYLGELFRRGGWPAGSFEPLFISSADVQGILEDDRVAGVTLTGSEPAGRSVARVAGGQLKKVVLELGGSDPFIVMPSADIGAAARAACRTRTANNGQACIAGKRFVVHREVYEQFVEAFAAALDELLVGDPLDDATDVGPLASEAGRRELLELVEDAVTKGAVARTRATGVPARGWFMRPLLLEGVTADMRLFQEEAFGPVATVFEVSSLDEAVALANATSFGLSSSVWTNDETEERVAISAIEAGAVFVNGVSASFPELPFGGVKSSGLGRELGAEGIRELCNLKTVWRA